MIEEPISESEDVAKAISDGIKALTGAIAKIESAMLAQAGKAQPAPVVHVAPAQNEVRVTVPEIKIPSQPQQAAPVIKFPEPKAPTRWSFDVIRDRDGKLSTLVANPLKD